MMAIDKKESLSSAAGSRVRALYSATLCLTLGGLLTGCAATGMGSSADLPTASDETTGQRRAQIRLELAVGYLERGQLDIALDETKKAIAADPHHSNAYNLKGLIYSEIGDKQLAEESFRRAVSLNARDGDSQHNLGWMLCDTGRTSEGLQFLNQALVNPYYRNKTRSQVAKGLCQMKAGDAAAAEATLQAAHDESGQGTEAAAGLAELFYKQNDLRKAAMYASQANVKGTGSAASLWLAMRIENKLGNRDGVARYARQLEERFPQSRELRLYERGAWND